MKNLISVLLLLCAITSCSHVATVDAYKCLKETIVLPDADMSVNPATGTDFCYTIVNKQLHIWYLAADDSDKVHKLYDYNPADKKVTDTIILPANAGIDFSKTDFYVDSSRIAYFLEKETNSITILSGGKLSKARYSDSAQPRNTLYVLFFPFEVVNNQVLLYKVPAYAIGDRDQREKYFSSRFLSLFTVKDSSFLEKNNFASFPSVYKDTLFDEYFPIVCTKNDKVFYAFSNENVLYEYSLSAGAVTKDKITGVTGNDMEPCNADSIASFSYDDRYEVARSSFVSLSYDPVSDYFLLFQAMKVKSGALAAGYVPSYDDKPVMVNVLDSNYNCIKKISFPNQHRIFFNRNFCYNHLLYIPHRRENSSSDSIFVIDIYGI